MKFPNLTNDDFRCILSVHMRKDKKMNTRCYGLDIYRILAMLMITALHINNQYCRLLNETLPVFHYCFGVIVEYFCFAGVNCFAMLSGWLMGEGAGEYDRKWGYKTISFAAKIVLWGLLLYLVVFLFLPGGRGYDFNIKATFIPIVGFWWYINAYCGLLIFMPLLRKGLSKISLRELAILSGCMFFAFSILPMISPLTAELSLRNGYSMIWLIICFIYGAALRKFSPQILCIKRINYILTAICFLSVLIPSAVHLLAGDRRLMNYLSPFCVLQAATMLLLMAQINISGQKMIRGISFISTNSLGIYLLHCYPYFWNNFICRKNPAIYPLPQEILLLSAMILLLMAGGVIVNYCVEKIYQYCRFDFIIRKILGVAKT